MQSVCVCGILLVRGLALKQGRQAAQSHYLLISVFSSAAVDSPVSGFCVGERTGELLGFYLSLCTKHRFGSTVRFCC